MKNLSRNSMFAGLAVAMLLACSNSYSQYTDCKAFGFNGDVKSVSCDDSELDDGPVPYSTLTFTRDGKVATLDDEPLKDENTEGAFCYAERDSVGHISACYTWSASGHCLKSIYTYNEQGRIATVKSMYDDKDEGEYKPVYDTDGNLIERGNVAYTILKKDSHGNWITRTYKSEGGEEVTESRTITYYESTEQDSTKDVSTSDLRMYELKGEVNTMRLYNDVTQSDSWTIGFSQQGKWITAEGKPLSATYSEVDRDDKGRILSTLSGENDAITHNTYTYNAQGYVEKCDTDYGLDGYSKESFTYNAENELVKSRLVENMGYDEPDQPAVSITYTILDRDDHGNWTQRKVAKSDGTSRIQKRVITYY